MKAYFLLFFFAAVLGLPPPPGCPQTNPTANCAQHGLDCTACIADPNCGFCSVIPVAGDANYQNFQPCMDITQGPGCCPRYPSRWETGNSTLVSLQVGYPVNPSAATIFLLPGEPLALPIRVTSPVTDDLAIDLMILQDLSGSFKNDIQAFANLLPSLVVGIKKINSDSYFGLASFIETPLEPFGFQDGVKNVYGEYLVDASNVEITWSWPASWIAYTQQADTPCLLNSPSFGYNDVGGRTKYGGPINWKYCMETGLSPDYTKLQARMFGVKDISHNNIDYAEPSLDGMYYASKCHANWRVNSRKVLTVVTDARYQGTSAETCTTVASTDPAYTRKGAASCTLGTSTPANTDYVARNYYEAQNNEDCFLDPPTATWTSSFVIPTRTWSYDPAKKNNRLPGAGENYLAPAQVSAALRSKGIVPLIACAEDPTSLTLPDSDKRNLWYWEDLIGQWGFGFAKLLLRGAQSNLVDLILAAISDISKSMVMVIENTVDPSSDVDPLQYVVNVDPPSRTFANVQPGDRNTYIVTFLVPANQKTVGGYVIKFTILGYGDCYVTVTNSTQCKGCQGVGNNREDMCGFCNPPAGQANRCVDCAGVVGGRAVIDLCGICGGDNSNCTDCRGLAAAGSTFAVDACGLCLNISDPRFGTTCVGCDGVRVPGGGAAQYDLCGVCAGANDCVACNDEVFGSAFVDDCGVCVTLLTEQSDTCRAASVLISPGAAAGIAVGIAIFIALAVIAAIIIFAKITKNFIDERKFMNAFAAGNSVGTNPLHVEKAGWHDNAISKHN